MAIPDTLPVTSLDVWCWSLDVTIETKGGVAGLLSSVSFYSGIESV
jgi:hypothetical protein